MLSAAQCAALQRDRAELRQRAAVPLGNVGDVADHVDAVVAGERQVALDVDAASAALSEAAVGRDGGGLDAAAPDHAASRRSSVPSESTRVAGGDLLDAGAEVDLHALVLEHLGDVAVGAVGERLEQRVAVVEQVDLRRARRRGRGTRPEPSR